MAGQPAVAVVALGVAEQIDALDAPAGPIVLRVADERPDLVSHRPVHPLFHDLILAVGPLHHLVDGLGIHLQDLRQGRGDQVLVLLAADRQGLPLLQALRHLLRPLFVQLVRPPLDHQRVQLYGVRRGGHGQHRAVAVVDGPPGGGDGGAHGLLLGGPVLHLVVAVDGQVVGLDEQGHEGGHAEDQHQDHGPALDGQLGPADGVRLAVGFFCHFGLLSGGKSGY